jgi:pyruvate dehydrogenase E2 component (dihydrolipoamide acetyltransferase)
MSTTITIPELGEGVDSVDVVSVLVSVGDRVEVDQPLIEVETEKAAVEVPSTAAGTITEIHVEVGGSLGPDAPVLTLDTETESAAETDAESESESAPATDDSDSGSDQGQEQQTAAETAAEATPATDDTSPPQAPTPSSPQAQAPQAPVTPSRPHALVPAAPTVRRFAREVGIDLTTVTGSGPGGRISIDDVKAEANRRLSSDGGSGPSLPDAELPDFSVWGEIRREPMSKVRSVTARNMSRAWLTAPQVTNNELADITEIEKLRKSFKERVEAAGGKLTMTAILIRMVASALKLHPTLNASVDQANNEIVYKDFVNIGVAVDTERGLLVPVIKNADEKNITEIAVELDDLARRARNRKLKPDEMQGGTFSISNLGGIGGTGFSPIVNWPEVAILGVSRGRIQPVWDGADFQPRLMLPLSLTYDHRLVDGAEAARFLRWLANAIEQPMLLALEG